MVEVEEEVVEGDSLPAVVVEVVVDAEVEEVSK